MAPFVEFQFFSLFFFFPKTWIKILFFFSQEKFTRHSLTRFQRAETKKKQHRKKKKHHFYSLTRFSTKSCKFQSFPGKKKYGTFEKIHQIYPKMIFRNKVFADYFYNKIKIYIDLFMFRNFWKKYIKFIL